MSKSKSKSKAAPAKKAPVKTKAKAPVSIKSKPAVATSGTQEAAVNEHGHTVGSLEHKLGLKAGQSLTVNPLPAGGYIATLSTGGMETKSASLTQDEMTGEHVVPVLATKLELPPVQ